MDCPGFLTLQPSSSSTKTKVEVLLFFTCMVEVGAMPKHRLPFDMKMCSHTCPYVQILSVPSSEQIMSVEAIIFIILQIFVISGRSRGGPPLILGKKRRDD